MSYLNDWYDWWRLGNALICAVALFWLLRRYIWHKFAWRSATLGFWYACVIWTFTGFESSLEGIYLDAPLGVRVMLVTVGGIVTLFVSYREGVWVDR